MSITTRYSLATYPGSARAWNGNNVLALLKQPSKSHLAGSSVILRSYGVNSVCDLENLWKILMRETRDAPAKIVLLKIVRRFLYLSQQN